MIAGTTSSYISFLLISIMIIPSFFLSFTFGYLHSFFLLSLGLFIQNSEILIENLELIFMAENGTKTYNNNNGKKVCDIIHFYNKQRSNSLQVYVEDPYLKNGQWLTSGSIRLVLTKYGEPNQVNAIKLTFAEATELIFRLQNGLQASFNKEAELQK